MEETNMYKDMEIQQTYLYKKYKQKALNVA